MHKFSKLLLFTEACITFCIKAYYLAHAATQQLVFYFRKPSVLMENAATKPVSSRKQELSAGEEIITNVNSPNIVLEQAKM